MMFFLIYNFSSQRQKVADEKNIARIQKEMVKLGQQMAVTMEEYNKVLAINQTIREQLQNEEEKAFKMEESLKVEMKIVIIILTFYQYLTLRLLRATIVALKFRIICEWFHKSLCLVNTKLCMYW